MEWRKGSDIWYKTGNFISQGQGKRPLAWELRGVVWGWNSQVGKYLEGKQDGEWIFFDKEGNNLPNLIWMEIEMKPGITTSLVIRFYCIRASWV